MPNQSAISSRDANLCSYALKKLFTTSRALKTLRYCNQVFIKSSSEKELLGGVCKVIVKEGGYVLAWIGFCEKNPQKSVKPVAWDGIGGAYMKNLKITWADDEHGRGPAGTAIRTAKPYVAKDILKDPGFNPWRLEALKCGYHSSIALPLIFDKHAFGVLSIYAKEQNGFNDEEEKLLFELSNNLSYSLMNLKLRIRHHLQHHKMQRRIEDAFVYTVGALARAAEANDEDTGNHILRVGEYCVLIAKKLKMPKKFIENISLQAQLHDVGKIHVDSSILKKAGSLTSDEWGEMKKHTIFGSQIVGNHPVFKTAGIVALTHHERWDGSGYPYGLKGGNIPIEGRIIAMADQYDAMRNARIYKPAFGHEEVYKIITSGDGRTKPSDFDPDILRVFKETHLEFNKIYESLKMKNSQLL